MRKYRPTQCYELHLLHSMKKRLLKELVICFFLVPFSGLKAQNRLGIFAGPQITTAKYRIDFTRQEVAARTGFLAGLVYKVAFDNQIYFAPALYFSRKGYKATFNKPASPPSEKALNVQTTINTLETALLLQYDFSKNPGHFFMKAGPSFDISLSGQEKFDTAVGKTITRPMVFSFADYGYVTTAMNLHLGYEGANGLLLTAFYTHGMGNFNNADGGPEIRHRVAGVALGYYLIGRTKKRD